MESVRLVFAWVAMAAMPFTGVAQTPARALALQDSAWDLLFSDLDAAVPLIEEVLRDSVALPDSVVANSLSHRAIAFLLEGRIEEALPTFQTAVNLAEKAPERRALIQTNQALALKDAGELDAALRVAGEVLRFWEERGDALRQTRTLSIIGTIYELKDDYEAATRHYLAGSHVLDREDSTHWGTIGSRMNNLGNLFLKVGDWPAAAEHYREAADFLSRAGREQFAFDALLNLVSLHRIAQQDSAFKAALAEAEEWLEGHAEPPLPSLGRLEGFQARRQFLETGDLRGFEEVWQRHQATMSGRLGFVLEWGKALAAGQIDPTPLLARLTAEHPELATDIGEDLLSIPALAAQWDTSLLARQFLATIATAQERLHRNAATMRGRFATQQLEDELAAAAERNALLATLSEAQSKNIGLLAFALIAVALASLAGVKLLRSRHAQSTQLLELRAATLEDALRQRKEDLALQLMRQSELQRKLGQHVEDLADHHAPRDTLKALHALSSFEASRQQFESAFQELFPHFQRALQAAHPRISPAEMDLAMLLMLGLNNAEVGQILHLTPPGVFSRTHRLRKRLGGSTDEELSAVLSRYATES